MKLNIAVQACLGLILSFMGIALLQTFHAASDPNDSGNVRFVFRLHASWIITLTEGLIVFSYGFLGFWLAERKRSFWRINLNLAAQIAMLLLTALSVSLIVLFDSEKAGLTIVWSTFIILGFLVFFQIIGVLYQVGELYGFFKTKTEYVKEQQALREREYLEAQEKGNDIVNDHQGPSS